MSKKLPNELLQNIIMKSNNPNCGDVNSDWAEFCKDKSLFEKEILYEISNSSDVDKICNKNKYYQSVCKKYFTRKLENDILYEYIPKLHIKRAIGKKSTKSKILFSTYTPMSKQLYLESKAIANGMSLKELIDSIKELEL